MSNHFAKRWDYTLRIKHIFMDAADLPEATETAEMGKRVSAAVSGLADRVRLHNDHLASQLDECAAEFDELDDADNPYEARDRFNEALVSLYDVADAGKRVRIA